MHKRYDWVEESRKARLQEAWGLRRMGEHFLKEANELDPEGYSKSREGQLQAALDEIARMNEASEPTIHHQQVKRYSAKAVSIAKKALETLKGSKS